jgi:hypothetical protein
MLRPEGRSEPGDSQLWTDATNPGREAQQAQHGRFTPMISRLAGQPTRCYLLVHCAARTFIWFGVAQGHVVTFLDGAAPGSIAVVLAGPTQII